MIEELYRQGKTRTAETYQASLNSFKNFRNGEDIALKRIDAELIDHFQSWQTARGISLNTISFYNRILRASYNRGVEMGLMENLHPFRNAYTGIGKTIKRSLPLSVIKKIKNIDLTDEPHLDFARDMFILSFMLRGMSFIDMAFLKKKDFRGEYIFYHRRKTGQQLAVKWTKEMQVIINKYPQNPTEYFLPIITKHGLNERYVYKKQGELINRGLKEIATRLNLLTPLSMYVARHSWASIAKDQGVPLSVISESLGHDNESTTRIYLSSLDIGKIDQANRRILSKLG